MSTNEVYRVGQYLPAQVPDTAAGTSGLSLLINSGVPIRIGSLNAVTASLKGEGGYAENATLDLAAAWLLPVTIVSGPLGFGTPVYLVTATGLLSTVATAATFFGWIVEESPVATGTQTPVVVKLGQTAV